MEWVQKTYCQPLCIIDLAGAEQGFQRIVAREDETSKIDKEFAANVEEDQEEVETN